MYFVFYSSNSLGKYFLDEKTLVFYYITYLWIYLIAFSQMANETQDNIFLGLLKTSISSVCLWGDSVPCGICDTVHEDANNS